MKRFALFLIALFLSSPLFARTDILCSNVTTVSTATGVQILGDSQSPTKTWYATEQGSGSVSATVAIQGSMDNSVFDPVAVVTLSPNATAPAVDSYTDDYSQYNFYRCNVTAISGTNAAVTVSVRSKSP